MEKFRYWTKQTLPTVYDDTLSYYELLEKVVNYLNDLIEGHNKISDELKALRDWFENLDVQEEINEKLDQMVEDGTMDKIINENIFNELNNKVDHIEVRLDSIAVSLFDYSNLADGNNWTNAIQTAIDDLESTNGGTIKIPRGTYEIENTIILPENYGVKIQGDGRNNTTIRAIKPMERMLFKGASSRQRHILEHFKLDGNRLVQYPLEIQMSKGTKLYSLNSDNFLHSGYRLGHANAVGASCYETDIFEVYADGGRNYIDIESVKPQYGLWLDKGATDNHIQSFVASYIQEAGIFNTAGHNSFNVVHAYGGGGDNGWPYPNYAIKSLAPATMSQIYADNVNIAGVHIGASHTTLTGAMCYWVNGSNGAYAVEIADGLSALSIINNDFGWLSNVGGSGIKYLGSLPVRSTIFGNAREYGDNLIGQNTKIYQADGNKSAAFLEIEGLSDMPCVIYFSQNGERLHSIRHNNGNLQFVDMKTGEVLGSFNSDGKLYLSKQEGRISTNAGPTENRPSSPQNAERYFDYDLNKPIWYGVNGWIDAMGNKV